MKKIEVEARSVGKPTSPSLVPFADHTGIPSSPEAMGRMTREHVFKCTGISVGMDIANTMTQGKLANHTAKR
nr:hypothetical protein [Pseudomonas luteola]